MLHNGEHPYGFTHAHEEEKEAIQAIEDLEVRLENLRPLLREAQEATARASAKAQQGIYGR